MTASPLLPITLFYPPKPWLPQTAPGPAPGEETPGDASSPCPITVIRESAYPAYVAETAAPSERAWLAASAVQGKAGDCALLPGPTGAPGRALLVTADTPSLWDYAALPASLPPGCYAFETALEPAEGEKAALAWALDGYRFDAYRTTETARAQSARRPRLIWPQGVDPVTLSALAEGVCLARDLINLPAADLGPAELGAVAQALADAHKGRLRLVGGENLAEGYPLIQAVGQGSARPPLLIDLDTDPESTQSDKPLVVLVGKGVCFDTGGLDLKPADNMKLMKKDMGGAAIQLGLAHALLASGFAERARLRLLIPAVENSISGRAMRPLDVLRSRKGLTVEVGHTDAEGRLVLADALAEAATMTPAPDLIIDCATLTGAARVALGTDIPALFCNDSPTADALLTAGETVEEPLWRLPLHRPYRRQLDSKVADLSNVSDGPYAGAITAALFLQEFIGTETLTETGGRPRLPWIHLDVMAWHGRTRPGRPEGGEALGLRALYHFLRKRFG